MFTPKPYMYYSSKIDLIPRRKQTDFDYSWYLAEGYSTVIDNNDSESDNETINDGCSKMHVVQVEHHRHFESTYVFTSVDV